MSEKRKKPYKFRELTAEESAATKKRLLEERASLSIAYQLGFYIGEEIVNRFLPTLSIDLIITKKNISVTCAEGDECRRLNDVWFEKRMSVKGSDSEKAKATEEEWKAVRAYHEMLEEKYLPKTVECYFTMLNITEENMQDFKKGIGVSLWNCDCSHYSANSEDIDVKEDSDGFFTIITLKKS